MVEVHVSYNNIHIDNSYEMEKDADMQNIFDTLRKQIDKNASAVLERSDKSLKNEWRAHNLLYKCHILRSHTADVDLEFLPEWYFKVGYFILGNIYYMIKG